MNRLFHNPKCSKSRAALTYLTEHNIKFELIEYLKTPLSALALKKLYLKLEVPISEFVRVDKAMLETLNVESIDALLVDDHIFKLIESDPKLLQRPIFETAQKAAIGRPLENIIHIL